MSPTTPQITLHRAELVRTHRNAEATRCPQGVTMLLCAIVSYGKVPEVDRTLTAEDVKQRKSVGFRMATHQDRSPGSPRPGQFMGLDVGYFGPGHPDVCQLVARNVPKRSRFTESTGNAQ